MNILLMSVLNSLGYATAGVSVTAIAIWLLLRLSRVQSPAIQRFAWLLVLVPGVIVWRMSMVLPVLPAKNVARTDLGPEVGTGRQISYDGWRDLSLEEPLDQPGIAAEPHPAGADLGCAIVLGGWMVGMVVLAVRWAHSYLAFASGLPPPLPPVVGWAAELQDICDELSIRHPITLHLTQRLGPALCLVPCGYRLLVPQAVWQRLSTQQRRAILRHELAHYVRGDLWKSFLARLLAWPQWFNPLAWLAVRNFEEAAEWACDDAVVAALGEARFDYLRALLELGQSNLSTPTLHAAIHGGSLQCRVRRLLSPTGKDSVMKKLVVIAAALALAAGGFARIRLASAQSPAAPSSERATATASGGAGSASVKGSIAVNDDDSGRVATATPAPRSPEAFIDLQRVIKEIPWFNQQMSAMQDRRQKLDQECKEQVAKFSALREELKTTNEAGRRAQLEKELADGQAKLQLHVNETKQQFLKDEAKNYHEAFEQVREATAEYAKHHGIRLVRRGLPSKGFADNKEVEDEVDTTDRTAVLARINHPVIYFDGPSEIPSDITDAIVQRVNNVKTR
jgi:beta-lactamase regulating signal transducer with metallopeptidase domain